MQHDTIIDLIQRVAEKEDPTDLELELACALEMLHLQRTTPLSPADLLADEPSAEAIDAITLEPED